MGSEPGEVLSPEKPEAAPAPPVEATPAAEEKCNTPEALSHDAADPEALSHDADVTEKVGQAMAEMDTPSLLALSRISDQLGEAVAAAVAAECKRREEEPTGGGRGASKTSSSSRSRIATYHSTMCSHIISGWLGERRLAPNGRP